MTKSKTCIIEKITGTVPGAISLDEDKVIGTIYSEEVQDGSYIKIKNGQIMTDHISSVPLFYHKKMGLASNSLNRLKDAVLSLGCVLEPDLVFLSNCVKFGYDYSGRTPYLGVFQLAPGSLLDENWNPQAYLNWNDVTPTGTLKEVLDRAILRRFSGTEAMLLSGGLDSSIVYYTLVSNGFSPKVYSVENGESEFLPSGVEFLEIQTTSNEEAVDSVGLPCDLGSLIPQVAVAKALGQKGVQGCFTGDGADELFGGYRRIHQYDSQFSDIFCELPYYHIPRVSISFNENGVTPLTPFFSPEVIKIALETELPLRTDKRILKEAYKGVVPDAILERAKKPWKSKNVLEDGLEHRKNLVEVFLKS